MTELELRKREAEVRKLELENEARAAYLTLARAAVDAAQLDLQRQVEREVTVDRFVGVLDAMSEGIGQPPLDEGVIGKHLVVPEAKLALEALDRITSIEAQPEE